MARETTSLIGSPLISPRAPLLRGRDLFRDYSRMMDNWLRGPTILESMEDEFVSPRVDVVEDEKTVEVTADIPGIDEKDIKVELRNGTLWIEGERKEEKKAEGRNFFRSERSYGSFERGIGLPCDVEKGNIEASFKNGVLRVVLPKTKEAREEVTSIKIKH
jgi:HSP20 family protein